MLPTYEAVLQPDGQLQFLDRPDEVSRLPRRVLVTFIDAKILAGEITWSSTWSGEPTLAEVRLRNDQGPV